ncbi:MAG TPA: class IV adenylate cyclase [Thermoleophilaceae bacterium]|nr:class IV adenylate cyclase [Thermoleophilaceae bacterium]
MTYPPRARNVELKAIDPDPRATLGAALACGAEDHGEREQRDTFFHAPVGRLKLREDAAAGAELIHYIRADRVHAKVSSYQRLKIAEPNAMRATLAEALGISVVVAKRRRVLLWETARIHLDQVEGLGSFLEIEVVVEPKSGLDRAHDTLARLRRHVPIDAKCLLPAAYADMLLDRAA